MILLDLQSIKTLKIGKQCEAHGIKKLNNRPDMILNGKILFLIGRQYYYKSGGGAHCNEALMEGPEVIVCTLLIIKILPLVITRLPCEEVNGFKVFLFDAFFWITRVLYRVIS